MVSKACYLVYCSARTNEKRSSLLLGLLLQVPAVPPLFS
jgi:hypothetical protein